MAEKHIGFLATSDIDMDSHTIFNAKFNPSSDVEYKAGTATTNGDGVATVIFNTPFTDANYSISLCAIDGIDTAIAMWNSKTINGFNIKTEDDSGKTEANVEVLWLAIPYNNP